MRDEMYIENDNVEDTWTTECQGSSCAVTIIGVDGRDLPPCAIQLAVPRDDARGLARHPPALTKRSLIREMRCLKRVRGLCMPGKERAAPFPHGVRAQGPPRPLVGALSRSLPSSNRQEQTSQSSLAFLRSSPSARIGIHAPIPHSPRERTVLRSGL
jgi:hypothetical protein